MLRWPTSSYDECHVYEPSPCRMFATQDFTSFTGLTMLAPSQSSGNLDMAKRRLVTTLSPIENRSQESGRNSRTARNLRLNARLQLTSRCKDQRQNTSQQEFKTSAG